MRRSFLLTPPLHSSEKWETARAVLRRHTSNFSNRMSPLLHQFMKFSLGKGKKNRTLDAPKSEAASAHPEREEIICKNCSDLDFSALTIAPHRYDGTSYIARKSDGLVVWHWKGDKSCESCKWLQELAHEAETHREQRVPDRIKLVSLQGSNSNVLTLCSVSRYYSLYAPKEVE
ncbi:uncharacterized protein BDZ99DRAFT_283704 [Mytilinidion resinicola]|uniref:Uncharacterized protein n=1 Tax=Mytilinidion resinicola TaxID=574789 RepID=A0A6A6YSP1_9PEZI|nr:uncharacterized protein BDZ99DRAFT_283704 [Mytilinidion resinicola]KAF2811942.1 hypothetical protein BDZ99DRAFT_283704 [Mytilinidion resinicola]